MSGPQPGRTGRIEAVLFDLDDTVVDFAASAAAGLVQLLGEKASTAGLSLFWQQLTELHYPRFLAGEVDFGEMQLQRLAELLAWAGLPVADRDQLLVVEAQRQDAMQQNYRLFPDVLPCLAALAGRAGLRVGVVSNSDGPHQRAKIASVGLTDAFEVIVISGEVGHPKPDPRIFHEACRQLGLPPDRVAYVGDRRDLDAQGATAAGLTGIWLDRSGVGATASTTPADDVTVPTIIGLHQLEPLVTSL